MSDPEKITDEELFCINLVTLPCVVTIGAFIFEIIIDVYAPMFNLPMRPISELIKRGGKVSAIGSLIAVGLMTGAFIHKHGLRRLLSFFYK